jgi:ABC-type branched-subunit amino acid transport system ATPase component
MPASTSPVAPLPGGMLLEARDISKSFAGLTALQGVSIGLEAGKIVGLIGPNGSGKSTLFDIITGFQRSDRGQIHYDGAVITGLAPHAIARRGLVRTFQMSEGGQRLTAIENLLAATTDQEEQNLLAAAFGLSALQRRERLNLGRAREILRLLGLAALGDELVGNLSGGQKKLIDLGRIFMARPKLSLLDEPTAGVNPTLINVILDNLRRMNREFGISLLIVEHNMQVIRDLCDYVYVLDAGSLICEGTPDFVQSDERVLEIYLSRTRIMADR